MRFVQDWDAKMISLLDDCGHAKPILTVYPRPYSLEKDGSTKLNKGAPVSMCFKHFAPTDGLPRWKARNLNPSKAALQLTRPFSCLFLAAGFNFSRGSLIKECGYSDEIDDVFFGEELFQMHKYWQKSYQLFSPPDTLIYHLWERQYRTTYNKDRVG